MNEKKVRSVGIALSLLLFAVANPNTTNVINSGSLNPPGWSNDIRLTFDGKESLHPSIVIDSNDNIHVIWRDNRDGNFEIYYKKLDKNGNFLVHDTRLTSNSEALRYPSITIDNDDNIHVVWQDYRYNNWEIHYMKLDKNGNISILDTKLTDNGKNSQYPSIATDSKNNVHIVWQDEKREDGWFSFYDLSYKKLDKNGTVLIDHLILKNYHKFLNICHYMTIAVDSNDNIHVIWTQLGSYGLFHYMKLDNDGNTIVPDSELVNCEMYVFQQMAIDSNDDIHIVWGDGMMKEFFCEETFYAKLDSNGNILIPDTKLTTRCTEYGSSCSSPSLAIDSNDDIHVVWMDTRHSRCSEIYYMKLDRNANILVAETRLTIDFTGSYQPSIAIDSNDDIHIVWYDNKDGNFEIYYKYSAVLFVSVVTDRYGYLVGEEPVYIRVELHNEGSEIITLTFDSECHADFIITDNKGQHVYLWSHDKIFLVRENSIEIGPGQTITLLEDTWNHEYDDGNLVEPGLYKIHGWMVAGLTHQDMHGGMKQIRIGGKKELNFVLLHGQGGDIKDMNLLKAKIESKIESRIQKYEAENPGDKIIDNYLLENYPNQAGVYDWAENIAEKVNTLWSSKKNLILIGHSLGGKSAIYAVAHDVGGLRDKTIAVMTINSPIDKLEKFHTQNPYPFLIWCHIGQLGVYDACFDIAAYSSVEDTKWFKQNNKPLLTFISAEAHPNAGPCDRARLDLFPRNMDDKSVPLVAQYTDCSDVYYYGEHCHDHFTDDKWNAADEISDTVLDYIFGNYIEFTGSVEYQGTFDHKSGVWPPWKMTYFWEHTYGGLCSGNCVRDHYEVWVPEADWLTGIEWVRWETSDVHDCRIRIRSWANLGRNWIKIKYKIYVKKVCFRKVIDEVSYS